MKSFITPAYTFTPGTSGVGTVNLSGISSFDIKLLLSIINQTRGAIIYATGSANLKYTAVSGNTVTLFVDTSTHDASDVLQVVYENPVSAVSVSNFPTTQAVSAANLPLPSGAATAAKQDALLAELQLKADLADTQPVSAASLPLPTGAATSAAQATLQTAINLLAKLTDTQPVSLAALPAPVSVAGTITSAQITVGTSAVRATVAGTAPNAARKLLLIKPSKNNTGNIYLGASSVTIANGLEIIGPDRVEFDFDAGDYYLISDTAGQTVEILEKA